MRPRVLRVLGFALVAGCTSLGGLTGAGGEDASTDAGSEASPVVPAPPASGDDAGDAGDGGDAAPPFRCSSLSPSPTFCADFDEGTLASSIGGPNTAGGGTVDLDDTDFVSPGYSMRVTTPAYDAGAAHASVSRTFGFAPTSRISLDFDVRIDSAETSATTAIAIATGGYQLVVFLGTSAAKLRETIPTDGGGSLFASTDRVPPAAHTWVHLQLVVTIASGASTAVLSYDGLAQGAVPIVIDQFAAANWAVTLGANFTTPPDDGHLLHFDNVVVDAK